MLTKLSEFRSSGTKDLSRGFVRHGDWDLGEGDAHTVLARPLLPQGVVCCAVATCLGQNPNDENNLKLGDGLVPVSSALGESTAEQRALNYPEENKWVGVGINHLDLLTHPQVTGKVEQWVLSNSAENHDELT